MYQNCGILIIWGFGIYPYTTPKTLFLLPDFIFNLCLHHLGYPSHLTRGTGKL
jgi:hypothetical protein